MNKNLKIILVSIGLCVLLIGVFIALNFVFYTFIHELIVKLSNKYLVGKLIVLDAVLFWGYPVLSGILFIKYDKNIRVKQLIQMNARILMTILFFLLAGCIVAVFTWWSSARDYLPSNVLVQPFSFYWTPFIMAGIFLPLYLWYRKRNKKQADNTVIDDSFIG